uniref:SRR1-like domain-containing protein n=1 Tax=Oryza sativa subsp. japonica TaxID=39947 RepID=Q6K6T9_ORYSJ|nr:hypothetical protein [Oryza sativa Japonica Group]BAD21957.1 hypothetical protein [Oryza sativa Japonica Group]
MERCRRLTQGHLLLALQATAVASTGLHAAASCSCSTLSPWPPLALHVAASCLMGDASIHHGVNDGCCHRADEPTLFYMPHYEASLYDAFFAVNWEPPLLLRHVCVLGNNFHNYVIQAEENRSGPAAKAKLILTALQFSANGSHRPTVLTRGSRGLLDKPSREAGLQVAHEHGVAPRLSEMGKKRRGEDERR